MSAKKQTVKYIIYCLIILGCDLLQNVQGLFPEVWGARCFLLLPVTIILAMGEHITDNGGLGVPALVHGSAADKIKILCQALLFQNGGHDPRRLGRRRAEDEPGLFQAAEHLRHAREDGTLVAAFLMVACTVALCRLFNFCLVAEVLAKALAERRAQIAAEVDIRGIHAHGVEDFF